MVKMVAVISPAKTLDFETQSPVDKTTDYRMADEAQALISILRKYSVEDVKSLMKLSDALAELNVERFKAWHPEMTATNSKQALFAFKGDVYTGLSAYTLTTSQINAAQRQVRILSGLYGLLRPLDAIQPYRLEMGKPLKNTRGKNLYEFWGDSVTDLLNDDIQENNADYVVNLASQEYFRVLRTSKLSVPVITPIFKDEKNGEYKIISFFAKKARGLMIRYMLDQQPTSLKALKAFDYEGYKFCEEESDKLNWVFKRKLQQ